MTTRKQLEKAVKQYSQEHHLNHTLHYGRIHGDEPRKFWYIVPFGDYARKIGNNLNEAIETIEAKLN